jgi:hypothetical protein
VEGAALFSGGAVAKCILAQTPDNDCQFHAKIMTEYVIQIDIHPK